MKNPVVKNISRETETRRWFPDPGRKGPCTIFHDTASKLLFDLVICINKMLWYNLKVQGFLPYLCAIFLDNASVITQAERQVPWKQCRTIFAGIQKELCWYKFQFHVFWWLFLIPFEKRSLYLQHVIVLKEESNMGIQMMFNFVVEESVRPLATLDEKTLKKLVELMARMIVRVQEKRKEKKHV